MTTISLCMIVKNEENNLANCLNSVAHIVDEIIIVDTGSTDKTKAIAKEFTNKIYDYKWDNNFANARNFSFTKGTMDYLMWLDADDILTTENSKKLLEIKNSLHDKAIITADYHCTHNETGSPTLVSNRVRLISRSIFNNSVCWAGAIHETINYTSHLPTQNIDIFITHTKNHNPTDTTTSTFKRNFTIIENQIKSNKYTLNDVYYYIEHLNALGKKDQVLNWVNKALKYPETKKDYNNVTMYLIAHDIYIEQGNLQAAYDILINNESQNAHMAEFYTILGRFFCKHINDFEKATHAYKKAMQCTGMLGGKIFSRSIDYYYYLPYMGLGEIATATGNYKKAFMYYNKAAYYKPTDPIATGIAKKLEQILNL